MKAAASKADDCAPAGLARPKLVVDQCRVIADALVIVSPADPNWWRGMAVRTNGEIRVWSDEP